MACVGSLYDDESLLHVRAWCVTLLWLMTDELPALHGPHASCATSNVISRSSRNYLCDFDCDCVTTGRCNQLLLQLQFYL